MEKTAKEELGSFRSGQSVLKLAPTEQREDRELDFELDFLSRLTTAELFTLMFEKSRQMAELLRAHGHGEVAPILKRP